MAYFRIGRRRDGSGWAASRLLALALLAVLPGALGIVSCTSVLDLDGYSGASGGLCDLLNRCYGKGGFDGCLELVSGRLERAESDSRESWLQYFSDNRCLANCRSAYRCLDVPPVCSVGSGHCTRDEHCCGFTKGTVVCDTNIDHCCRTKGGKCEADEDCCASAGRCDADTHTCGGVVCTEIDQSCTYDFECCTGACDPVSGVCAGGCSPDMFECTSSDECCSHNCDPDGFCLPLGCGEPGLPCVQPTDCCMEYECVPTHSGFSICSDCPGVPYGAPCTDAAECCSGFCHPPGYCADPQECKGPYEPCMVNDECCTFFCDGASCQCVPEGGPCGDTSQCCGLECAGNVCGGIVASCGLLGDPCSVPDQCCTGYCDEMLFACSCIDQTSEMGTGCHDACKVGPPMDKVGCDPCLGDPACAYGSDCVMKVCAVDPYCCSCEWDDYCVSMDVFSECNFSCGG